MEFDEAVQITLLDEGPLSYDTDDLLPTKWGIRASLHPEVKLSSFSQAHAIKIYQKEYWDKTSCNALPPPLRFMLFDAAVNQGPIRAIRLLQQSLKVKQDGLIGHQTLAAAQAQDPLLVLDEFCARRIGLYITTKGFLTYGLGWIRRCTKTHRLCILDSVPPPASLTTLGRKP